MPEVYSNGAATAAQTIPPAFLAGTRHKNGTGRKAKSIPQVEMAASAETRTAMEEPSQPEKSEKEDATSRLTQACFDICLIDTVDTFRKRCKKIMEAQDEAHDVYSVPWHIFENDEELNLAENVVEAAQELGYKDPRAILCQTEDQFKMLRVCRDVLCGDDGPVKILLVALLSRLAGSKPVTSRFIQHAVEEFQNTTGAIEAQTSATGLSFEDEELIEEALAEFRSRAQERGAQRLVVCDKSNLDELLTARTMLENYRGCNTPAEEFLDQLLMMAKYHPLTPTDVEDALDVFRDNFSDMLRDVKYLTSRYPKELSEAIAS